MFFFFNSAGACDIYVGLYIAVDGHDYCHFDLLMVMITPLNFSTKMASNNTRLDYFNNNVYVQNQL